MKQGREAATSVLLQEIFHGKLKRRGVVLKKMLQEPRSVRGVCNGRVWDSKDCGMWRGNEDFRGDLKEGGYDVKTRFS